MAEHFILQCHDKSCKRVTWSSKGGGVIEAGEGSLSEASQIAKGRRTLVFIPAVDILITSVNIPTRNRQRLLQAIPFALENELTQEIGNLHFAAGTMGSDNTTPVAIISREKLDEWLEKLDSAGIEPLGIYPDLLGLPLDDDAWSVYQDDKTLQIRTNDNLGSSVDAINGGDFLSLAIQQAGESAPRRLTHYQLKENPNTLDLATIAPDCEVTVKEIDSRPHLTTLLADSLNEKEQLNLLQGEYQRVDKMTLQWKRWLPAAALGLILVVLSIGTSIQEYFSYKSQNVELQGQIRATFQQAFPKIKRIVDPRTQMEQQLKIMQQGQSGNFAQFASLFAPAASVIKESPNTSLDNISFRDGQLNLQLIIKELQALERLKKAIESKHLNVEIRSANASDNQVTSHLRITGGS